MDKLTNNDNIARFF